MSIMTLIFFLLFLDEQYPSHLPRLLQQLIWNRLKQRGVPDFLNIVALIGKIYCRDFLSQLIVL